MPPLMPRGVTLAEVVVTIALLGIVGTAIHRTLVTGGRTYRAQMQRIDGHQTLRIAATLLPAELRELDAGGGDLVAVSADSVRLRAPRHVAFLCAPPDLGPATPSPASRATTLVVARQPTYGLRGLDPATDSVLVYYEGDPATPADDGWVAGELLSVTDAVCPAPDGRAARALQVRLGFAAGQLGPPPNAAVPAGAPVRGFEPVTYLRYRASDGRHYIGQRSGRDLQPILGPVARRGLTLVYYDAYGHVTGDRRRVAAIEARVHATPTDSIVIRVALRGNSRW